MNYWQSPETTAVNRLPMLGLPPQNRRSLNGNWRFQLLRQPQAPLGQQWAQISVPGLWTRAPEAGKSKDFWDLPHYTNVVMPWPLLPPHVPAENPTGVYERDFNLTAAEKSMRAVLRIGGFESLAMLWVNGQEVGMSKDSRLQADFEVTKYLKRGKNTVRIVVVKWSDATYIEDQDQWWHGGITRDVELIFTPTVHLSTCRVTPGLKSDWHTGTVELAAQISSSADIDLSGHVLRLKVRGKQAKFKLSNPLAAPDGNMTLPLWQSHQRRFQGEFWNGNNVPQELADLYAEVDRPHPGVVTMRLEVADIKAWSAESPNLYPVSVELIDPDGVVIQSYEFQIGFRDVRVIGNELLVNGQPIYIYGINRHDFHPKTGRVLSPTDIRADLLALKALNYNAIRTSHYPNDPALLTIADELGFYVVEEANIESHAFQDSLCNDLRYQLAWLDRVTRMIQRDIHHPSVIMWSLGNESGAGLNHAAAAAAARKLDPSRPLHYEGAIRFDWSANHELTDVVVPMYPHMKYIHEYALAKTEGARTRPLIMCEYSHAMGNSNGNLKEYWQIIHSTPGLQGGFIWEYWDHGLTQELPDGTKRRAYGGDFGDTPNDGSFVCDGMFWPDRTPKPAAIEMKQIAAPIQFTKIGSNYYVINNAFFTSLNPKNYRLDFLLQIDGETMISGEIDLPSVAPRSRAKLEFKVPKLRSSAELSPGLITGEVKICFDLTTKKDTEWAGAGHRISFAQFELPAIEVAAQSIPLQPVADWIDEAGNISLPGISSAFSLNLFRAPTENDIYGQIVRAWQEAGLAELNLCDRTIDQLKQGWRISSTWQTSTGIQIQQSQRIQVIAGGIEVKELVNVPKSVIDLPRVGLSFTLPAEFNQLTYFGAGPHETYPDRKMALVARYSSQVRDQYVPYIKPQESGGHSETRWFQVKGHGQEITLSFDRPIQFSCLPFSQSELAAKGHDVELTSDGRAHINFDLAHRGVGTASCGPDTLPEYLLTGGKYELTWRLQLKTLTQ